MKSIKNMKIKTEQDVRDFIEHVLYMYDITIDSSDVECLETVNEIESIWNGADPKWFDFGNPENYDDDGTYVYQPELDKSKKIIFDKICSISIIDGSRLDYICKHTSDKEYIEKLIEIEEHCQEFCEDEGIDYAEVVLEVSDKKEAKNDEYRWAQEQSDKDYIDECNRQFRSMLDDSEAWGNID